MSWLSKALDPTSRSVEDIEFPEDWRGSLRQHGVSGIKGVFTDEQCAAWVEPIWSRHEDLLATVPADAPPFARSAAWGLDCAPEPVREILAHPMLQAVATEYFGTPGIRFATWQAFARHRGAPATPWHNDGGFIPITGDQLAFWIPLTPTPSRSGLVALMDLDDGRGLRPLRQIDLDAGDLTFHDMHVVHRAEDVDADFLALGLLVYPDGEKLKAADDPRFSTQMELFMDRVFVGQHPGDDAVSAQTPLLSEIAGAAPRR